MTSGCFIANLWKCGTLDDPLIIAAVQGACFDELLP